MRKLMMLAVIAIFAVGCDSEITITVKEPATKPHMKLLVGHSGITLGSPQWVGSNISGTIDWGDGSAEKYREGIKHSYEAEGEYKALFDMSGPIGFKIEQLGEIDSIEISYN
ncbi:MAG: hypothetical protein E7126_05950 [Rikenellaceae bacterium]|nr:hypothetical protein [Rikenellaceae bacterium]